MQNDLPAPNHLDDRSSHCRLFHWLLYRSRSAHTSLVSPLAVIPLPTMSSDVLSLIVPPLILLLAVIWPQVFSPLVKPPPVAPLPAVSLVTLRLPMSSCRWIFCCQSLVASCSANGCTTGVVRLPDRVRLASMARATAACSRSSLRPVCLFLCGLTRTAVPTFVHMFAPQNR